MRFYFIEYRIYFNEVLEYLNVRHPRNVWCLNYGILCYAKEVLINYKSVSMEIVKSVFSYGWKCKYNQCQEHINVVVFKWHREDMFKLHLGANNKF